MHQRRSNWLTSHSNMSGNSDILGTCCQLRLTDSAFLDAQIASAGVKWRELKDVFRDSDIKMWVRVQILEATVRPRLLYLVQAWSLQARERDRLNSIWMGFLRHMVRGGFQRRDRANNDSAMKYSNYRILAITNTTKIHNFCDR